MTPMAEKIATLWPEIILAAIAFAVMLIGLSPSEAMRRATYPISVIGLIVAAVVAAASPAMGIEQAGGMALFMKVAIALVGLVLLVAAAEQPELSIAGEGEGETARGEFFGFLLLSLIGAMLCAGADDLIWLFLALELTSLPTYVLVAMSRMNLRAPEAGVKYFFLGALSASVFLYGFAFLYGATGTTYLSEVGAIFAERGVGALGLTGLLLAVIGVCFKIAAVPMHYYAADVYQGAATPISAFLAFTPKAAGFVTLILLMGVVPAAADVPILTGLIWALAVATMLVGNTVALLQNNVKRVLAYSSIAHSGYMLCALVPVAAGVGVTDLPGDVGGVAAILFYLVTYGVMNLGAFAVLGMLQRSGEEAETFDDLKGLAQRRPGLAVVMAICVLSLTGIPPLVGFWGKLFVLGPVIGGGYYTLAALLVINSAIAAFYYLRILSACYLYSPTGESEPAVLPQRRLAAVASAVVVVVLSLATAPLLSASQEAAVGAWPGGGARQAAPTPTEPTGPEGVSPVGAEAAAEPETDHGA